MAFILHKTFRGVLSGASVAVYRGDVLTQFTTGVTLTPDFDGVVGHNMLKVDPAAAPADYLSGFDYNVVGAGGTICGAPFAGYPIAQFSINNQNQTATLAADGLDAISLAVPTTVPANFREMMLMLYRYRFKKKFKNNATGQILCYADNGTSVITTQAYTVSGSDETVQAAT